MPDLKSGKPAGRRPVKRVPAPAAAIKATSAPAVPEKPAPKPAVSAAPAPAVATVAAPKAVPAKPAPAPIAKPIVEVAKIAAKAPEKVAETVKDAMPVVEKAAVAVAKTVEPVVTPAAQTIQKGPFAMAEKITAQSFVPTPENVQALFGDFSSRTKAAVEKSTKLAEEFGEFTKGNVEALISSSRVAAKGAETIGQEAAEYGKKSFETATAAIKGFAAAKSPTELFKLQSDYARSAFDAAVTESSKLSEAMLKLFGDITQPLSSRVAIAAEKIKATAA